MPKTSKKKDFTKTKLKVGKHKQAPQNQTNTVFKAKAIVVPNQSLNTKTNDSSDVVFQHTTALLSHKSGEVRKDALDKLTSFLQAHPPRMTTVLTPLMARLVPLILDDTKSVRTALLDLMDNVLSRIPQQTLSSHTDTLLLYISSAMSHISPSIRADSSKFLAWALENTNAVDIIIASQLSKFMTTFGNLFGWASSNSSIQVGRSLPNHLDALNSILHAALDERPLEAKNAIEITAQVEDSFISHRHTEALLRPCEALPLFFTGIGERNLDSTNYTSIAPHTQQMLRYLTNKFTDAVNGDKSLCLPILHVAKTLSGCTELRKEADWTTCVRSLSRSMANMRESSNAAAPLGVESEWRIIRQSVNDEIDL